MTDETTPTQEIASGTYLVELGTEVILALGVLALGVATGSHISLMVIQDALMASNTSPLIAQAGNLMPALEAVQWLANTSSYAAAVLLIGGGVLARRDTLQDWVGRIQGDEADA